MVATDIIGDRTHAHDIVQEATILALRALLAGTGRTLATDEPDRIDAVEQGQSVRDVYLRVLLPAQQEVGQMWLVGEINVAEET